MPNRVLLNAAGLKVSKPGIDVLTATDAQLVFNSNYSMVVPLIRGRFLIEARDGEGTPANTRTIGFGRTFSTVPLCLFYVDREFNAGHLTGNQHIGAHRRAYAVDNTVWSYRAHVYHDHFVFTNNILGPGNTFDLSVDYFVWNFDL